MEQENEHVFTAQEMLDVAENEVYIIDAATFKDCHLADTRVRQMLRQAADIIDRLNEVMNGKFDGDILEVYGLGDVYKLDSVMAMYNYVLKGE